MASAVSCFSRVQWVDRNQEFYISALKNLTALGSRGIVQWSNISLVMCEALGSISSKNKTNKTRPHKLGVVVHDFSPRNLKIEIGRVAMISGL